MDFPPGLWETPRKGAQCVQILPNSGWLQQIAHGLRRAYQNEAVKFAGLHGKEIRVIGKEQRDTRYGEGRIWTIESYRLHLSAI
jgi:hypothetical protein